MITYSRQEMERQLVADQALWGRLPSAFGAVLWPLEIALLGWGAGWWAGLLTVILLGVASVLVPPRLRISLYLIDLLDRLVHLPLAFAWLVLVWHLWQREPAFPILGQPLVGAVVITALLWLLTRPAAFLSRLAAKQVPAARSDNQEARKQGSEGASQEP